MSVLRLWERVALAALLSAWVVHRGAPIPSLLSLAFLLVVPLGLSARAGRPGGVERRLGPFWLPAGGLASISLLPPPGGFAVSLAVPWLFVCSALAAGAIVEGMAGLRAGSLERSSVGDLAARCFVPVGALWLVAARAGMQPLGFVEPIVSLTAIHFHFAGFAAPVLVARGMRQFGGAGPRRALLTGSLLGVVVGPWLLAAGFVISPGLKVLAVGVIGTSLTVVALISLASLRTVRRPLSRALLGLSSLSALVGMTLAAVYSIGEYRGEWWLLIGDMERTHGWIQGVGFALFGLMAWRWERGAGPESFRVTTPRPGQVRAFAEAHRDHPLSYPRAGAGGWWRNRGQSVVGEGPADFAAARAATWALRMFPTWTVVGCDDAGAPGDRGPSASGAVPGSEPIPVGRMVVVGAWMFRLVFAMNACRVVEVIDEEDHAGFVYGTVEGHAMRGEELFLVRLEADGRVTFEIESFSRPAHPLSWLVLPWVRRIQRRFVVDAMTEVRAAVDRAGNLRSSGA